MALEKIFSCPGTIQILRNAPLGKHIEEFGDWLLENEFSTGIIRKHLSNVSHFNEFLQNRHGGDLESLSSDHVNQFLASYSCRCFNSPKSKPGHRISYSINRFVQYLRGKIFFEPCAEKNRLMEEYLEWMRLCRYASDGTLEVRRHSLNEFLKWLGPKAEPERLSELTSETIESFFIPYSQVMGRPARRSMQSALRTFFRFCLYQGYIRHPLDLSIPTFRTYKLATVPRGLSHQQALQVLRGIRRDNDAGRRDYAICQLLHTYGVRSAQVRTLCLQDIDWAKDQILFRACKQGKNVLLPLTEPVGESLLDYLKNARPRRPYPEVFLTVRAPYHPLPCSNTIAAIVKRHIHAAGINVHSQGAHAFRHGFATRMLQEGHSLKEIADVLGHRCLSTTFIYTKVDLTALRQVGLPLPEGGDPCGQ